jgi:hypothetical protein
VNSSSESYSSSSASDTYRFKKADPASGILMSVDGGGTLLLIVLPLVSLVKAELVLALHECVVAALEDGFEAFVGTFDIHPGTHPANEKFLGLAVSELFIATSKKNRAVSVKRRLIVTR